MENIVRPAITSIGNERFNQHTKDRESMEQRGSTPGTIDTRVALDLLLNVIACQRVDRSFNSRMRRRGNGMRGIIEADIQAQLLGSRER